MRIFVVRHGATDFEDFTLGPQDLHLNDSGKEQAKSAALVLKKLITDPSKVVLITSPLLRTLDTAEEIASTLGIKISSKEEDFKEYYYGDYRTVSHIDEIPADAENKEDFFKRVLKTFSILLLKCKANPVITDLILVTHKHVFECIADSYIDSSEKIDSIKLSKEQPKPLITIEKGEIALFEILEDFSLRLEMVKHLNREEKIRKASDALQSFREASSSLKLIIEQRKRKKISIAELRLAHSADIEFYRRITEQQLEIISKMQETISEQAIEIRQLNARLLSASLPLHGNNSNTLFYQSSQKVDVGSTEKEDKEKDLISSNGSKSDFIPKNSHIMG